MESVMGFAFLYLAAVKISNAVALRTKIIAERKKVLVNTPNTTMDDFVRDDFQKDMMQVDSDITEADLRKQGIVLGDPTIYGPLSYEEDDTLNINAVQRTRLVVPAFDQIVA